MSPLFSADFLHTISHPPLDYFLSCTKVVNTPLPGAGLYGDVLRKTAPPPRQSRPPFRSDPPAFQPYDIRIANPRVRDPATCAYARRWHQAPSGRQRDRGGSWPPGPGVISEVPSLRLAVPKPQASAAALVQPVFNLLESIQHRPQAAGLFVHVETDRGLPAALLIGFAQRGAQRKIPGGVDLSCDARAGAVPLPASVLSPAASNGRRPSRSGRRRPHAPGPITARSSRALVASCAFLQDSIKFNSRRGPCLRGLVQASLTLHPAWPGVNSTKPSAFGMPGLRSRGNRRLRPVSRPRKRVSPSSRFLPSSSSR